MKMLAFPGIRDCISQCCGAFKQYFYCDGNGITPEKVAILNWLDLHMHHYCNAMQGWFRLIVQVSIF
jgi:hypothetical protein